MTKSILARCYLVVKVNEVIYIYICDTVPPCMEKLHTVSEGITYMYMYNK